MKTCTSCGAAVSESATTCPHCYRLLTLPSFQKERPTVSNLIAENPIKFLLALFGVMIVGALLATLAWNLSMRWQMKAFQEDQRALMESLMPSHQRGR